MIVYKSHPINVSGINSKNFIGDEGLLFNSFSYQDEISLRFAIDNIFSLIKELIDYTLNILDNILNSSSIPGPLKSAVNSCMPCGVNSRGCCWLATGSPSWV